MPEKNKMVLRAYLDQLKETRKGKPSQIKEALEIYVDLWEKAIRNGTVSEADEMELALSKIDKAGGLVRAAD